MDNSYDDPNLRDFLTTKGYTYVYRLAIDDIYVKKPEYLQA